MTGLSAHPTSTLADRALSLLAAGPVDAVSLARDVALMAAAGYAPERVEVLDLFPNTHHVETVTRFVPDGH